VPGWQDIHVIWTVRETEQFSTFQKEFAECAAAAAAHSNNPDDPEPLPALHVSLYVTGKGEVSPDLSLMAGAVQCELSRPKLTQYITGIASHGAAAGQRDPLLVFACGPEPMVNQAWDATRSASFKGVRCDFHYETFEF